MDADCFIGSPLIIQMCSVSDRHVPSMMQLLEGLTINAFIIT